MDELHRSPTAHSRLVLLLAEWDEQLRRVERDHQLNVELIAKCVELGMINSSLNDHVVTAASDLKQMQAMSGVQHNSIFFTKYFGTLPYHLFSFDIKA
jgi:hypothetical protein